MAQASRSTNNKLAREFSIMETGSMREKAHIAISHRLRARSINFPDKLCNQFSQHVTSSVHSWLEICMYSYHIDSIASKESESLLGSCTWNPYTWTGRGDQTKRHGFHRSCTRPFVRLFISLSENLGPVRFKTLPSGFIIRHHTTQQSSHI
jgi:hypothetical protein